MSFRKERWKTSTSSFNIKKNFENFYVMNWYEHKSNKKANQKRRHVASKLKVRNKVMFDSRYINIIKFNRELNYKNFDSFEIVRTINNSVYELNLSKSMKKMSSVFHLWLLHLKDDDSLSKQKNHEFDFIVNDVENNELWETEKILKFKINMRMIDFEFQQRNAKDCFCYYVKWIN